MVTKICSENILLKFPVSHENVECGILDCFYLFIFWLSMNLKENCILLL